MVKDIIVFADVHTPFDDDFSGVYLTQSDYDLVAAATRKNDPPTQADFETQTLVDVSGRHFEVPEAAEPIASEPAKPIASESRATIETNQLTPHADGPEASADTELADALSAYEGVNHPHESTNKVRVKRRDTGRGVQRGRRRRRGAAIYNTSHPTTRTTNNLSRHARVITIRIEAVL
ncbi:uncharacterized protein LOC119120080 isoform X2 [Syngnathus acus]|uniref:uncharacterized protein LOC119120080 isoform X2 n=1 Tax=Syngnathus acus TaxID=161584 RepID=UPI001885E7AA|nr:uncharacterized protein LOC119120080 isoform X2 [Syngnathus acus]